MKKIVKEEYQCDTCKAVYSREDMAIECEKHPVTEDKGVKVGDKVKITNGQGAGSLGLVTKVFVIDKDWGHYAWKQYWHTIGIIVDVIGSYGSRLLTYTDYETI